MESFIVKTANGVICGLTREALPLPFLIFQAFFKEIVLRKANKPPMAEW